MEAFKPKFNPAIEAENRRRAEEEAKEAAELAEAKKGGPRLVAGTDVDGLPESGVPELLSSKEIDSLSDGQNAETEALRAHQEAMGKTTEGFTNISTIPTEHTASKKSPGKTSGTVHAIDGGQVTLDLQKAPEVNEPETRRSVAEDRGADLEWVDGIKKSKG